MLKPDDFVSLYRDFQSAPARFDCGKKCSPFNGGVPFCCDTGWVVPIAYVPEWKLLQKRSRLWHEFRPRTQDELKMVDDVEPKDGIFIECRGAEHCERHNRSVSCRAFPYEPYFDAGGNMLGLIYNRVLEDKCYLVDRHRVATRDFIASFLRFFGRLMEKLPSEKELYMEQSRNYRRLMSRRKKPVVVLTLKGPYRAAYRGGRLLGPWTRPDPRRYRPKV